MLVMVATHHTPKLDFQPPPMTPTLEILVFATRFLGTTSRLVPYFGKLGVIRFL